MEDIFKDVKEAPEKTFFAIEDLKYKGMGWKKISKELNKPISTLRDIYKKHSPKESNGCGGVRDRGAEGMRIEEKEVIESVADHHIIEYIKEHCITNKELDKLKESIENLVNKRLNHGLKQIKEEIKNGLNA